MAPLREKRKHRNEFLEWEAEQQLKNAKGFVAAVSKYLEA